MADRERPHRPGLSPPTRGKPTRTRAVPSSPRVYPRPHGEASRKHGSPPNEGGLSPPTRGSPPGVPVRPSARPRVYPRSHGEALQPVEASAPVRGLSPPTRGSPGGWPWRSRLTWVYPRPHGEARHGFRVPFRARGLSPPTRGSRSKRRRFFLRLRSIPAHTGKPLSHFGHAFRTEVYPRPHGEARVKAYDRQHERGLSPPTRGSHRRDAHRHAAYRSIPAHTGKPPTRARPRRSSRVYPRPHGEASLLLLLLVFQPGLSPPTRGSLGGRNERGWLGGSIPAHTGKPPSPEGVRPPVRVYPRPHGEASQCPAGEGTVAGLSPPTRGSRTAGPSRRNESRSIPAHTGKPGSRARPPGCPWVYPRPHGEALREEQLPKRHYGLSPPTRGSHGDGLVGAATGRSIPAHTGKPRCPRGRTIIRRVYPRPHGEARVREDVARTARGLSPPTRGSHRHYGASVDAAGSIPAHTGKPSRQSASPALSRVYPRPHGEAPEADPEPESDPGLSPPTRGSQG